MRSNPFPVGSPGPKLSRSPLIQSLVMVLVLVALASWGHANAAPVLRESSMRVRQDRSIRRNGFGRPAALTSRGGSSPLSVPAGPRTFSGCAGWTTVTPELLPFARLGTRLIYDPVRDRLVVAGGSDANFRESNTVYVTPLAGTPQWIALTVAGTPPAVLDQFAAVYDPVRDRILYIGGYPIPGGNYPAVVPVWALSLAGTPTWSQLAPVGSPPSGRDHGFAVYDASQDRVIYGGGLESGVGTSVSVWTLSLAGTPTWTALSPTGTPPVELRQEAVFDSPRNRVVAVCSSTNQIWTLSMSGTPAWTHLAPVGTVPTDRDPAGVALDASRNRLLVYAGADLQNFALYNDVYALSLTGSPTWSKLAPPVPQPEPALVSSALVDPVRNRLLVFSGYGQASSELWGMSLTGGGSPAWTQLVPVGGVPLGRSGHTAILDKPRNRMVVFGGVYGDQFPLNDVWVHDLAGSGGWTLLTPTGARPSQRFDHAAVFDSVRNRMVVFGGSDQNNNYNNDVWALSLTGTPAWTQLSPSGTGPSARRRHGAVHDRSRNRMVIFGGNDGNPLTDVWALSLTTVNGAWAQLATTGTGPFSTLAPVAGAYDVLRDRIVFTGSDDAKVWTLPMTSLAYQVLLPSGSTPAAHAQGLVLDPFADRMIADDPTGAWVLTLSGTPAASIMVGSHADHTMGPLVMDTPRNRTLICGGGFGGTNSIEALTLSPGLRGFGLQVVTPYYDVSQTEGGSVEVSPASGCFSDGATVTLTAHANPGFIFEGWDGSDTGNSSPLVVTMNADKYFTAYFARPGVIGTSFTPQSSPDSGEVHMVVRGFNFGPQTNLRASVDYNSSLPVTIDSVTPDGRQINATVSMWPATPGYYFVIVQDAIRGMEVGPSLVLDPTFKLSEVYPVGRYNSGVHTLLLKGDLIQPGATALFRRVGAPDIVSQSAVVAPDGASMTATFDLTGKAPGAYDAYFVNPGNVMTGHGRAFFVNDVLDVDAGVVPLRFSVAPNPVHDQLHIDLSLTRTGPVEVSLFDLQGRKVAGLMSGTYAPGRHQVSWAAKQLASGLYFARCRVEGREFQQRVLLAH